MPSPRFRLPYALTLAAGLACVAAPVARADEASRTTDFLASLGVNTHLNYTDGTYADYERVIADLNYLGIHHLRDWTPNPDGGIPYRNYLAALDAAAAAGNRFDFITSPEQPLGTTIDQLSAVERAHPGTVFAVEGPNETNNNPSTYKGMQGMAASLAYQRDLYRTVHGWSLLRHASVYYYTGFDPAKSLAGLADYANCHPYSEHGAQPAGALATGFGLFKMAPPYPKVVTEAGYFDVPGAPNGVDDAIQAKDTLNLYLDAFAQGVSQTYVYQLVSAYPDQGRDTQSGLFRMDHTPKPAATAIHNVTTLLADRGRRGFRPGALDYVLSNLPATGDQLLLEKSSGVFDLILWAEPPNWNDVTHQEVNSAATPVTVTLTDESANVAVYDPTLGLRAVRRGHDVDTVTVALRDHPVIIEVRPTRRHVLTAESAAEPHGGAEN
jgi:hypothetical protein